MRKNVKITKIIYVLSERLVKISYKCNKFAYRHPRSRLSNHRL